MSKKHPSCASHCCLIHGCKYGYDDCPVVTGKEMQDGACYECYEEQRDAEEEAACDAARPYGCPKCGSIRVVFSGRYDIPAGTRPKQDSPHLSFVLCLACKHEGSWTDFTTQPRPRRAMIDPKDFGNLVEGIVEQDPMSDRFVIRYEVPGGEVKVFDVQETLKQYKGQEVRLIIASLETVERVAKLVAEGELSVEDALIPKK